MLDHDQDLALQALAHAIAHCLETVGFICTKELLGTIALDLIETGGHTDQATLSRPHPGGRSSPEPHEAVSSRHLSATRRQRRPTGYPSATTP